MIAGATKLRRIKSSASTLTSHHRSRSSGHPKLRRAVSVDVGDTAGVLTVAGAAAGGFHSHTHIVPIYETHVVEVFVVLVVVSEGEFDKGDRRSAAAGAPELAAAVAGGAVAGAGGIEFTARSGPESARPARWSGELG